jgi:hypothetical protein
MNTAFDPALLIAETRASAVFGCTTSLIRELVSAGRVRKVQISPTRFKLIRADLEKALAEIRTLNAA